MDKHPAFSAIICNDDGAVDLRPCVEAALNQAYGGPFEVIVVDDGTPNKSISLIETMPVTVVRKDRPHGWPDSIATAAGKARYDILAFTDSDCIVPDNWLFNMENCMKNRDIVTGNLDHGVAFFERFSHLFTHFHFASLERCMADFVSDGCFGIRKALLSRCIPALPLEAGMGGGSGAVLLSAIVQHMGIPILLDPALQVHHKSERFLESLRLWYSDYGTNTLDLRRANPGAKGAGLMKLGYLAPFVYGPGRWLTDLDHLVRSWRRFGMRRFELPLCLVWYGACGAAYLLGMLNRMKAIRKAEAGASRTGAWGLRETCDRKPHNQRRRSTRKL